VPEGYCPICGVKYSGTNHYETGCKPSVLRAIDAANTRALNNESENRPLTLFDEHLSLSTRLEIGFQLIGDDEPQVNEDLRF